MYLLGILLLAAALKVGLVVADVVPFNSDEAIVALMARHMLHGDFPVFFYGQAYMGSLDAFLVAVAFDLFGEQVWVIRLVQGLLYMGVLVTTVRLGKAAFDSWEVGLVAASLLSIPAMNATLYTTVSLGGYGEALLLGNLIVLLGLHLGGSTLDRCRLSLTQSVSKQPKRWLCYGLWAVLGFLIGLGMWAFGLTLIYSVPVSIYLVYVGYVALRDRQIEAEVEPSDPQPARSAGSGLGCGPYRLSIPVGAVFVPLILFAGFLIGSAPWWWFAWQHGFEQLLWEMQGGAIAGVERLPWLLQIGQHLTSLLLLGSTVIFGLRPPWDVIWLAMPLLPFVLMFWLAVILHIFRCLRGAGPCRLAQLILVGVMVVLVTGFVFSSFGADPSGRYFVPLAIPLALFGANMIWQAKAKVGKWAYGLLGLVLVYNLWGTVQCASRFPPGITTQFYEPARIDHRYDKELIEFLYANDESYGYTNYWVAYPLAFLSQEELIFVPRLPYHPDFRYTERDNRYAPYNILVENAGRVAYITTKHPALDELLQERFLELGVVWKEKQIGDHHIFYGLSRPVRPEEIGLGVTTP